MIQNHLDQSWFHRDTVYSITKWPVLPYLTSLTPHPYSISLISPPSSLIPHPSPLLPSPSSLTPSPSFLTPTPAHHISPSLPHTPPPSQNKFWRNYISPKIRIQICINIKSGIRVRNKSCRIRHPVPYMYTYSNSRLGQFVSKIWNWKIYRLW